MKDSNGKKQGHPQELATMKMKLLILIRQFGQVLSSKAETSQKVDMIITVKIGFLKLRNSMQILSLMEPLNSLNLKKISVANKNLSQSPSKLLTSLLQKEDLTLEIPITSWEMYLMLLHHLTTILLILSVTAASIIVLITL